MLLFLNNMMTIEKMLTFITFGEGFFRSQRIVKLKQDE